MFFVKGFAAGADVDRYSGSVAAAIEASAIAAIIAAAKRGENSVARQTCVTEKVLKEGSISETVRKPTGNAIPQFPLWIKVPTANLSQAISSRRHFSLRLPLQKAANKHIRP
jgi:hypothetical protein